MPADLPATAADAVASSGEASHPASIAFALATGSTADWRLLFSPDSWRDLFAQTLHALVEIALVGALVFLALQGWQRLVRRLMHLAHESLSGESRNRVSQRSETLAVMVGSLGKSLIIFMGTMIVLSRLGLNVAPILASAGILGVAVGFGAQSLVKDVITGFFIVLEDQYGVGDSVVINGNKGLVERMNLRVTQLRDDEGRLINIPNGKVEVVINASKGWGMATVEVTVDAKVPPEKAMAALRGALAGLGEAMAEDLSGEVEIVGVEKLGAGDATLKARARTLPGRHNRVARAMRQAIWEGMPRHGVSPKGFPEPAPEAPPAPSGEDEGLASS